MICLFINTKKLLDIKIMFSILTKQGNYLFIRKFVFSTETLFNFLPFIEIWPQQLLYTRDDGNFITQICIEN